MTLNNIKQMKNQKGFTIVELLIVIVIIGILAALVIVAYNGIQNRAKTTSHQSSADTLAKKIEAYNSVRGTYLAPASVPNTTATVVTELATVNESTLTGSGISLSGTAFSSAPADQKQLNLRRCGTGASTTAPSTAATVTATTGMQIGYWNYSTSAIVYEEIGQTTGLVGANNVGCGLIL
jgi:prepilin-type N-terminal cleavage/methylation domain-containing protein